MNEKYEISHEADSPPSYENHTNLGFDNILSKL